MKFCAPPRGIRRVFGCCINPPRNLVWNHEAPNSTILRFEGITGYGYTTTRMERV